MRYFNAHLRLKKKKNLNDFFFSKGNDSFHVKSSFLIIFLIIYEHISSRHVRMQREELILKLTLCFKFANVLLDTNVNKDITS